MVCGPDWDGRQAGDLQDCNTALSVIFYHFIVIIYQRFDIEMTMNYFLSTGYFFLKNRHFCMIRRFFLASILVFLCSAQSPCIPQPEISTPDASLLRQHSAEQGKAKKWVSEKESALRMENPGGWEQYAQLSRRKKCSILQDYHRESFSAHREKGIGEVFCESALLRSQGFYV